MAIDKIKFTSNSVATTQDKLNNNFEELELNKVAKGDNVSSLINDGDGNSPFATQDYVEQNGGKIDKIKVNGEEQQIVDKAVDIEVPTDNNQIGNSAGYITKDVNNLTNYTLTSGVGAVLGLSINTTNYLMTLELKNNEGLVLSSKTIDFPIESMVVDASYENGTLTLTLQNGTTIDVDISDIISGLVSDTRTIVGLDLKDDITKNELLNALNVEDGAEVNKINEISANGTKIIPSQEKSINIVSGKNVKLENLNNDLTINSISFEAQEEEPTNKDALWIDTNDNSSGETPSFNEKLTFTGSVNAEYDGTQAVTVNIPSGSGGSNDIWEEINTIAFDGTAFQFEITQDSNGQPFNLKKMQLVYSGEKAQTGNAYLSLHNGENYIEVAYISSFLTTGGGIRVVNTDLFGGYPIISSNGALLTKGNLFGLNKTITQIKLVVGGNKLFPEGSKVTLYGVRA